MPTALRLPVKGCYMSKLRRRLLYAGERKKPEKKILAWNYRPNGTPFMLYNDAFDVDAQTIFADILLDNQMCELQCVFDVGINIQEWQAANTYAFHTYYPVSVGNNMLRLEFLAARRYTFNRYDLWISGGRMRVAINANGYYINGRRVNDISALANDATQANLAEIRKLKRTEIGSIEGIGRSYATYKEVSVYDRLLTHEELIAITLGNEVRT